MALAIRIRADVVQRLSEYLLKLGIKIQWEQRLLLMHHYHPFLFLLDPLVKVDVQRIPHGPLDSLEVQNQPVTHKFSDGSRSWSKFMNRFAISPIPPLATESTDGGGIVYSILGRLTFPTLVSMHLKELLIMVEEF